MKKVNNAFDVALGNVLRSLRKERNHSMQYVADRIGVTKQSVSLYELGQSAITVSQLKKICDIYDVNYGQIIRDAAAAMEYE